VLAPARIAPPAPQIFLTFFKTLEGRELVVELKNDLSVRGTLQSVDQYLNLKLGNVEVVDKDKFPQLVRAGPERGTACGARQRCEVCRCRVRL
jgi:small nuclear ribonucleoprotein (snRNP)-like protein